VKNKEGELKPIYVHSKVLICDDKFFIAGSANMANRSMGFDTEVALTVLSGNEVSRKRRITEIRDELLAEHLGIRSTEFQENVELKGSVGGAIESIQENVSSIRRLEILDPKSSAKLGGFSLSTALADPEGAIDLNEWMRDFAPVPPRIPLRSRFIRFIGLLAGLSLFAGALLLSLWHDWAIHTALGSVVEKIGHSPHVVGTVISIFITGSVLLVPFWLLSSVTILIYGPWHGAIYSVIAALLAAEVEYALGRIMKRKVVRRIAGKKLARASAKLQRPGFIALLEARWLTSAPFSRINYASGASGVSHRDFLISTFMAVIPIVAIIALIVEILMEAAESPRVISITIFVLSVALVAFVWHFLRHGKLRVEDFRVETHEKIEAEDTTLKNI